MKITLSEPIFDNKEKNRAIKAIKNLNLSQGKNVLEFESSFSKFIGTKYGIACNSGSSANLIALSSLKELYNHKNNDEVIIPAATFATVPMPVSQLGYKPVFVDVNLENMNISVDEIKRAITKKTKILMIVHTLGCPANMKEITKICKKNKILLFEDCCEAHGSKFDNKYVGSFGDISAFSFFVAHNITTGEGGMVLTNNSKLNYISRSLREFGRIQMKNSGITERFFSNAKLKNYDKRYVFERLGYNLRMTDILAAFGIEQVKKLKKINSIRNKNARYLISKIKSQKLDKFIDYPRLCKNEFHSFYTFPIRLLKKNLRYKLSVFLESKNIQTRPMMAGCLPDQPCYNKNNFRTVGLLKNSRNIRDNVLFFGIHPKLGKKQLDYIIINLKKFFKNNFI